MYLKELTTFMSFIQCCLTALFNGVHTCMTATEQGE